MSFLVIEGLDGSGKTTQVGMLRDYLEARNVKFKYLHFPRLEEGIYGKLIAKFLRGELGKLDQVDPYLIALIFAGDRNDARDTVRGWIEEDYLVIVDRYVYSNIAFQGAKIDDADAQMTLAKWIMDLEFRYHNLPVPDKNIFLDVPFDFTKKRLSENRSGAERDYLKGGEDIHENDLSFQGKVRDVYHRVCTQLGNLSIINCATETGSMRRPVEIFDLILKECDLD